MGTGREGVLDSFASAVVIWIRQSFTLTVCVVSEENSADHVYLLSCYHLSMAPYCVLGVAVHHYIPT